MPRCLEGWTCRPAQPQLAPHPQSLSRKLDGRPLCMLQVAASAEALERVAALLTPRELQHCRSAAAPAVERERLLARALVRSVLAEYAAGAPDPGALLFERNENGKPALLWPRCTPAGHHLHFNLTHTASIIGGAGAGWGGVVRSLAGAARGFRVGRARHAPAER